MNTDQAQAPTLLEEAAAELRKARDRNDQRRQIAAETGIPAERAAIILEEADVRSIEITDRFIAIAAIEAGRTCCCHCARPEAGPQS